MRKLVHPILTGVGILSVVLGIIGIFLPLMPTTPFLLLAAFCFARSSPRCHQWLHQHRWFGPYLTRYQQRHAMTRRDKLLTLLRRETGVDFSFYKPSTILRRIERLSGIFLPSDRSANQSCISATSSAWVAGSPWSWIRTIRAMFMPSQS